VQEEVAMGENVEVIDNLDSHDFSAALSANQGRVLREMIEDTTSDTDIDAIFA
jgi:hypothetical protein